MSQFISFDAPATLGSQLHNEISDSNLHEYTMEKPKVIDMNNITEEDIKELEKSLVGKQSVEVTFECLESSDADTQGIAFAFYFTLCCRRYIFRGRFHQCSVPWFRCNATLWFSTVAQLRGCHRIAGIVGPARTLWLDIANGVTITGTTTRTFYRGYPFTGVGRWNY